MQYIHLLLAGIIALPLIVFSVGYAMLPAGLLWLLGARKASEAWMRFWARALSRLILFLLGTKVTVEGKEHVPSEAGVCFMANHQSMLDILVLVGSARIWAGIIAKAELRKVPILSQWCKALHCVFIDRKSPHSSVKAILKGVEYLKAGRSMVIFPEGTRSKTGKLGPMKKGSLKLATRAKAPIVPVTIKGTRAGLENLKGFRRVPVYVSFGEPISTDHLSPEALQALPDTVYGAITERYESLPAVR